MTEMRLEIPADWLPISPWSASDKQQALLGALKRGFGIGDQEICEAGARAREGSYVGGSPVDKIIILCTASQFGMFVHMRCLLGGRNLVQDLKSKQLEVGKTEPGIGSFGTVFDVRPNAKSRVQTFQAKYIGMDAAKAHGEKKHDASNWTGRIESTPGKTPSSWFHRYFGDRLYPHQKAAVSRLAGIDFGTMEARAIAHWMKDFQNIPNRDFVVLDESHWIRTPKWDFGSISQFSGRRVGKTAAMEAAEMVRKKIALLRECAATCEKFAKMGHKPYINFTDAAKFRQRADRLERDHLREAGVKVALGAAYGMGAEKLDVYKEAARAISPHATERAEIERLRRMADNSEAWARCTIRTDIREKSLARVARLRREADALEAKITGKATWENALQEVKDFVRTGKLEWCHVHAIKAVFGVAHHSELKQEDVLPYMKAVQSVVDARKSGLPKIVALKQELKATQAARVRAEISASDMRSELCITRGNAGSHKTRADAAETVVAQLQAENTTLRAERNRARETNNIQYCEIKELKQQLEGERSRRDRLAPTTEFTRGHSVGFEAGKVYERESIVNNMEAEATNLYEQGQGMVNSVANRLRAACYSLRNHAKKIREGKF